jgi:hypothetical protein
VGVVYPLRTDEPELDPNVGDRRTPSAESTLLAVA